MSVQDAWLITCNGLTNCNGNRVRFVRHNGCKVRSYDFHLVAIKTDGEVIVYADVDDAKEMRFSGRQGGHGIFAAVL